MVARQDVRVVKVLVAHRAGEERLERVRHGRRCRCSLGVLFHGKFTERQTVIDKYACSPPSQENKNFCVQCAVQSTRVGDLDLT